MKKKFLKKNIFILYFCILISLLQIIIGPTVKKIYKDFYNMDKLS